MGRAGRVKSGPDRMEAPRREALFVESSHVIERLNTRGVITRSSGCTWAPRAPGRSL